VRAAGADTGASSGGAGGAREAEAALPSTPPVVTEVWQPNSYTKALFGEMGEDKAGYFTLEQAHAVLESYVREKSARAAEAAGESDAGKYIYTYIHIYICIHICTHIFMYIYI